MGRPDSIIEMNSVAKEFWSEVLDLKATVEDERGGGGGRKQSTRKKARRALVRRPLRRIA